jgi:histidine phosphotransferase ChpT
MTVVQTPAVDAPVDDASTPLAFLVASRICHDLVGPLGAIANGLELMAMTGDSTPESELVADSVAAATARVRLFRLAYGVSSPGQVTSHGEVRTILKAIAASGRLSYEWTPTGECPRAEVRCALLLLQCLETAMPQGGRIRIDRDAAAWTLAAEGAGLRLDEAVWQPLRGGPAPETASLVHFALLPALLHGLGRTLSLDLSAGRIVARF